LPREQPDKTALTASSVGLSETRRFSDSELAALADHTAVGMAHRGVSRNDLVAMPSPD